MSGDCPEGFSTACRHITLLRLSDRLAMPLDPPAAELERFALAATVAEAPSAAASLLNKGSD